MVNNKHGTILILDEATILLRDLLQNTERSLRIKVETCSLLLENGADPNAVYEKTGHPVLHITTKSVQTIEVVIYASAQLYNAHRFQFCYRSKYQNFNIIFETSLKLILI